MVSDDSPDRGASKRVPQIRSLGRLLIVVVLMLVGLLGETTAANALQPIQPDQHFVGLVNGRHVESEVYTVCPGPMSPGRTGPVLGGQTLALAHVAFGGGYTGPFSGIYAWIVQDASATGPQQVKFTTYGTKEPIASSARVPCSGTGQVEFSSCPHLAPCAYGWRPNLVTVRFVNVAV
jgi:hypothetical protein